MTEVLDLQTEYAGRAVQLALKNDLNAQIDAVWDDAVAEDAAYYSALSVSPVPETPKQYPAVWMLGSFPSVLERPREDYPNVAVVSYRHRSARDLGDQYEIANNRIYVEAFVMHDDEATVNRLAQRYARAVHRTLVIGGFYEAEFTPDVDISNAAIRRVDQWTEDLTYIQGCRLEWELKTVGTW
jgi:hypothetical protein